MVDQQIARSSRKLQRLADWARDKGRDQLPGQIALAAYLEPVTLVEADLLGPVCAGIEVTLRYGDATVDIDDAVMGAQTESRSCPGNSRLFG